MTRAGGARDTFPPRLTTPEPATIGLFATGLVLSFFAGEVIKPFALVMSFGIVVGTLRVKTGSVYPGMVLHATFNAIALIVSVAT